MSAGAYIGYKNLFLRDEVVVSYVMGSSAVAGFPEDNMFQRQLSSSHRLTQFSPGGDAGLVLTLPNSPSGNMIVFIGSPIPSQITMNGSLGAGQVFNSPAIFDTEIDLPSVALFLVPWQNIEVITAKYSGVTDPGYADVQRVFIANAIELDLGVDGNWSIGVDDSGSLDSSDGKQWYESKGVRTRKLNINLSAIPALQAFGWDESNLAGNTASAHGSLQELQIEAGTTGEVFIVPRTDSGLIMKRLAVYGHLASVPVIAHQAGDNYSTSISVIEER